jgi:hypothetical protein
MFAACTALPVPLTRAYRCLPTDVLEACREGLQAKRQKAAHVGRRAIRPSAFDQGTAGIRVAGCRDAALATPCTTGVCRRRQAQVTHKLAGVSTWVRSPHSARMVTATVHGTPRSAWRASTTGEDRRLRIYLFIWPYSRIGSHDPLPTREDPQVRTGRTFSHHIERPECDEPDFVASGNPCAGEKSSDSCGSVVA